MGILDTISERFGFGRVRREGDLNQQVDQAHQADLDHQGPHANLGVIFDTKTGLPIQEQPTTVVESNVKAVVSNVEPERLGPEHNQVG